MHVSLCILFPSIFLAFAYCLHANKFVRTRSECVCVAIQICVCNVLAFVPNQTHVYSFLLRLANKQLQCIHRVNRCRCFIPCILPDFYIFLSSLTRYTYTRIRCVYTTYYYKQFFLNFLSTPVLHRSPAKPCTHRFALYMPKIFQLKLSTFDIMPFRYFLLVFASTRCMSIGNVRFSTIIPLCTYRSVSIIHEIIFSYTHFFPFPFRLCTFFHFGWP